MGDPKVETYMTAVIDTLVPAKFQVDDAMQRMAKRMRKRQDPQPMQLLALRRYVIKGGDAIVAAWPWTRVQRREHKDSIDALDVEARLVKQAFEDDNPGYELGTSPIRDLDRQVRLWCDNGTAQKAAVHYMLSARKELAASDYFETPTDASVAKFKAWMDKSKVHPKVTSAAPGLSDHGQQRAVDFVVRKDGEIIAGTESVTMVPNWRVPGWEKKLIDIANKARLKGPLPDRTSLGIGGCRTDRTIETPSRRWYVARPQCPFPGSVPRRTIEPRRESRRRATPRVMLRAYAAASCEDHALPLWLKDLVACGTEWLRDVRSGGTELTAPVWWT